MDILRASISLLKGLLLRSPMYSGSEYGAGTMNGRMSLREATDHATEDSLPNGQMQPFPLVESCSTQGRLTQTVVSDLDGTLLRSDSAFSYFMLIAFEASGMIRSWILLTLAPLVWLLYHYISEAAGIQVLIFVAFAGLRVRDIESVARAVLPKFYADDVHSEAWNVFNCFQKRILITANPRVMVEPFAKDYLGVEHVIGTELELRKVWGREYYTGFVTKPGVMVGINKEVALRQHVGDTVPDVALGDRPTDFAFMRMCKVSLLYIADRCLLSCEKKKLRDIVCQAPHAQLKTISSCLCRKDILCPRTSKFQLPVLCARPCTSTMAAWSAVLTLKWL